MALLRGMAIVLGGLVPHPAYAPDRGVGAGVVLVAGMRLRALAPLVVSIIAPVVCLEFSFEDRKRKSPEWRKTLEKYKVFLGKDS